MLQNHLRVNAMLTSPAFFLALTLVAKHRFIQKNTQTLAPRGEIASAMVTAAHHFAHRFEPNASLRAKFCDHPSDHMPPASCTKT